MLTFFKYFAYYPIGCPADGRALPEEYNCPVAVAGSSHILYWWIGGGVIALLLIGLFVWRYRNKRKR